MIINYNKIINKKIAAIFFDLDGTLLDTATDLLTAINFLLLKYDYPSIKREQLIPHISKGSRHIIKHILNLDVSESQLISLRTEFIDAYHQCGHQHTKMFPGIQKVLALLNSKNIPWGIITNKTTKLTIPVVELFKLDQLQCKTVVCADTTNNHKPHPDPMLKACSDLKVAPDDCIFIGDAKTDIEAGKAVNMMTVTASYGYIPDDEDIKQWDADFIINTPLELLQLINHIK